MKFFVLDLFLFVLLSVVGEILWMMLFKVLKIFLFGCSGNVGFKKIILKVMYFSV